MGFRRFTRTLLTLRTICAIVAVELRTQEEAGIQYICTFKETPYRWRAGAIGDKSIYYSCADCDSEELAGFLSAVPGFEFGKMVIRKLPNGFFKVAVFCAAHMPTDS